MQITLTVYFLLFWLCKKNSLCNKLGTGATLVICAAADWFAIPTTLEASQPTCPSEVGERGALERCSDGNAGRTPSPRGDSNNGLEMLSPSGDYLGPMLYATEPVLAVNLIALHKRGFFHLSTGWREPR
ncbi:hypothetical protein TcWFU_003076 [Taenia crassiceps]|uniref:Secreted protein n=1 Tax=Taenia crassiceps TaxID=6207 RepID=A0ABR4Q996_9CEST